MSTSFLPPRVSIRLLGEVQLMLDGQPLHGKLYGKVLALLAYLAVEPDQNHSREQLAVLFWPSLTTNAARTNLRQALYYLRQAFGENTTNLLMVTRETVRFSGSARHCQIDTKVVTAPMPRCRACASTLARTPCDRCLERLKTRANAYQGEFLAGLSLTDTPDFDSWLDTQRQSLRGWAFALTEQLRDAYEALGQLDAALVYAQRCIQLEPWNEIGQRQHMRLLALRGQHGAAQTYYDTYRASLVRDLNIEPEPSTRTLFETIHKDGLESEHPPSADTHQNDPPPETGRRQVTVLCCHIDFSPNSIGIEPEQLAEPRSICAAELRRVAGHITQGHDGYIYAYLGYPEATEQAGTLAVNAALALQARLAPRYRFRAGIHTGIIVTGFDPALPDIVGNVSGTAWQLCKLMQKGGIAISDATECLLHGQFQLQALKTLPSRRGAANTAQTATLAFRLAGVRAPVHRLNTLEAGHLIGRRAEMQRLRALWRQARQGTSQFLVVRGEAGIGKTRLARALRDEINLSPTTSSIRHLYCHPEHQHTPLHPVITLFESLLDFTQNDTVEHKRHKLRSYLRQQHPDIFGQAETVLITLLSIAPAGMPVQPPRQRKQETLDMLLLLLDSMARRSALLMVIEDAHWLDVTSRDLLERLVHRKDRVALLTLVTARPAFQPPWLGAQSVLELRSLNNAEIAKLARSTVKSLAPQEVRRIVQRADGVPLYAEEMAQIPRGSPQHENDIPTSLRYLLLARLDAVPHARRVVQLAATIGRNFEQGLLQRVAKMDAAALGSIVRELSEARLISANSATEGVYQFHHALIQEAAYAAQLHVDRQEAHQRVADALVKHYAQRAARQPEEVARHYTLAGNSLAAIPWWLEAGRQALRVSANAEAGEHLQAGLNLIGQLAPGHERDALELQLLLSLGQALLLLRGYGSEEAVTIYDRALALSNDQTSPKQRFEILWGQWMVSSSRPGSSFLKSWELAQELLQLARETEDTSLLVQAYSANTNIALWRNQIDTACRFAQAATTTPQTVSYSTLEGLDPCVTSLAHLSWAYWRQAKMQDALAVSRRSVELAQSLNNPDTLCFALGFASILHCFLKEPHEASGLAGRLISIATTYRLVLWQGVGAMVLGWTQAFAGDAGGIARIQACAQDARQIMPGVAAMFLHALAEAHGFLGQYDEQLAVIDEGLRAAHQVDEGFFREMLERLRDRCPAHQTLQ